MTRLLAAYDTIADRLNRDADWLLPTLARLVFAAVLTGYFWSSASTKFDGILTPSVGAYAQIYPKAFEAAGYDSSKLGLVPHLVVLFGGWAEFLLPLCLTIGLFTRISALGMIGFVVVQSLTDVWGHMVEASTIGAWFDRLSDAPILDQRALWVMILMVLVLKGAGPLSLDRFIARILHR